MKNKALNERNEKIRKEAGELFPGMRYEQIYLTLSEKYGVSYDMVRNIVRGYGFYKKPKDAE